MRLAALITYRVAVQGRRLLAADLGIACDLNTVAFIMPAGEDRFQGFSERAATRVDAQEHERAGDCCINAFMKSCFGTIKTVRKMTELPPE